MMTTDDIRRLIDSADLKQQKHRRITIMLLAVWVLALCGILRFACFLLNQHSDLSFYAGILAILLTFVFYPTYLFKILRRK